MTITPAAMMVPYGVSKPVVPVNLLIATVAVCLSGACRNVSARRNSFHAPMNTMMAVVNTPGAANGRITLRKATASAAVNHRCLLQFHRHLLEECRQVPHCERQAEAQARHDDGLIGVNPRGNHSNGMSKRTSSAAAGSG